MQLHGFNGEASWVVVDLEQLKQHSFLIKLSSEPIQASMPQPYSSIISPQLLKLFEVLAQVIHPHIDLLW